MTDWINFPDATASYRLKTGAGTGAVQAWLWACAALVFLMVIVGGRLKGQLAAVLALGALQGFVGWWMVASGLVNRVEVAQERLAIHLILACVTFAALVWIAVGLRAPAKVERASAGEKILAVLLVLLTLKQIFLGALVAGLRAGLVYNTWPMMDGKFLPPWEHLFRNAPWWMNFVDNPTTVQFDHRMAAYALLALALVNAIVARAQRRGWTIFLLVLVQAALGVATLVMVVPLSVALAHQAVAMIVLAAVVIHTRRVFPREA